jgi:hypothetical protein
MEAKEAYYRGKSDLLGRKRDLLTHPYLRRARLPSAPQASLSNPVCVWGGGWAKEGERGRRQERAPYAEFRFYPYTLKSKAMRRDITACVISL